MRVRVCVWVCVCVCVCVCVFSSQRRWDTPPPNGPTPPLPPPRSTSAKRRCATAWPQSLSRRNSKRQTCLWRSCSGGFQGLADGLTRSLTGSDSFVGSLVNTRPAPSCTSTRAPNHTRSKPWHQHPFFSPANPAPSKVRGPRRVGRGAARAEVRGGGGRRGGGGGGAARGGALHAAGRDA